MSKKEFEEKFHNFHAWTYESDRPSQHYSRDDIWQWIEAYVEETRKCAGCDNLIYHQVYCPNCK